MVVTIIADVLHMSEPWQRRPTYSSIQLGQNDGGVPHRAICIVAETKTAIASRYHDRGQSSLSK